MRSSRKQVSSASHSIPKVRFAEHALTSFGGLVVFQAFLQSIDLRARLRASLRHLSSSAAYDFSRIVLLLIVHTLLGSRRLRDLTRQAGRHVLTFAKGRDAEAEIRRLIAPWRRIVA
jgi:hypothetical protein